MGISIVQVSDKYVGSAVAAPATFAMASTPAAGSTVLVCIGLYQGSDGAVTSVTVGGQAAVLDIARTSALTDASIWRIQSFAGANGTVSITDSNGFNLYLNAVAIEVTGLADDPLEGEASSGTTSTTTDPIVLSAGAAPSTYPALFLGVFGFTSSGTDNGVLTTQGTSLYVHQNSTDDLGGAAAYQIVDDPASGQLAWSRTNANGWQAVSAYYLAADGEAGGYRARDLIALATNNSPVSVPLVDESAGAGDADKVPRLQADGKLHPSTYDAGPALSDDAPQPVGGTASAGTATEAARADHVHALPEILLEWDTPGTYANIERPDPDQYPNCEVLLIGSGAGGGAGRRGASTEICRGGGGGAGGRLIRVTIPTSSIGALFSMTVGAGGNGAPAVSTDSTNGTAGSAGAPTHLSPISGWPADSGEIRAAGGNPGAGGTTTAGNGGGSAISLIEEVALQGFGGGASTSTGLGSPVNSTSLIPPGGGGGGSLTANTTTDFAGGSSSVALHSAVSGGTAASPNGQSSVAGLAHGGICVAPGGGGGAAIHAAAGGNGGAGLRGSGGGGGGGSRNGNNSGAGGPGGHGYARLRFHR